MEKQSKTSSSSNVDINASLKLIVDTFRKFERKNKESDPKYIEWIEQISEPSYGLISSLLTLFLDELTDQITRENIFKVLKKLLFLQEEIITEQLISNKDFPKCVVNYIIKGNKTKMSDNPFYLLTRLYMEENFKEFISDDFIMAMFDGLDVVHEEDILLEIVGILVEINNTYSETDDNLFLKVHQKNVHARVFDELLLRLLNNEKDNGKQLTILLCINRLMDAEKHSIFYESDLESFIDIILGKLQTTYNMSLKLFLLEALNKSTRSSGYKSILHKKEEIIELIEDYQERDDITEDITRICKEIKINVLDKE